MSDDASKPDLTEFYKYSRPKKPPCKIGIVLDKLGRSNDAKRLRAALSTDNSIITGAAVLQWIEKREPDLDISNSAVRSHRERKCTCARA